MKIPIKSKSKTFNLLIDNDDYEKYIKYKWWLLYDKTIDNYYVITNINNKLKSFHRYIMNCKDDFVIDHRNHNTLDNRKSNLRICTLSQNAMNRKKNKNTSSKYKGVTFNKRLKKWIAQIEINNKKIHIGCFLKEKLAALQYNEYAKKYFGEYAYLNEV